MHYEKLGPIQKKIVILLAGGLSLGLSYSPGQRSKVFRDISEEWEKVNSGVLRRAIAGLYKNRMINQKEESDGTIKIFLLEKGKKRALEYKLDEIKIKPLKYWDKKWRMVIFDIPHFKKKARDILRYRLKRLGFYQYQKSVFVHPFSCSEEIDFLIEFYGLRPYVRQLEISKMDNDLHLQQVFKKLLE
ncbi:MAG: hypothetical protein Q8P76_02905 [bacterium]|nr:hypothetical protein [bacterium]